MQNTPTRRRERCTRRATRRLTRNLPDCLHVHQRENQREMSDISPVPRSDCSGLNFPRVNRCDARKKINSLENVRARLRAGMFCALLCVTYISELYELESMTPYLVRINGSLMFANWIPVDLSWPFVYRRSTTQSLIHISRALIEYSNESPTPPPPILTAHDALRTAKQQIWGG